MISDRDPSKKIIRCAMYTRKSTNEGLDQEFTSLDAQREACQSYIASQKSLGWHALPHYYDDGGFTGANLERPALKKLLSDIHEGKVDCVVVYKVDRLSRSLLDFTKLLELFDQKQVTFVSVTQHFNTNSSMGRLTLNILLSFAQFEREMISERTKDKMAAARKKGRWLGGKPLLGYDIDRENRRLVVNEQEAAIVRDIFELYLIKRSMIEVAKELTARGLKTKCYVSRRGNTIGGCRYSKSNIFYVLNNVLYLGKVRYQDTLYPGQHSPIIGESLFNQAQQILKANRPPRGQASTVLKQNGLLSGRLHCKACNASMFYTYAEKHGGIRKYTYYVCLSAQKRGYSTCPTRSVRSQSIEEAVVDSLRKLSRDPESQQDLFKNQEQETHVQIDRIKDELSIAEDALESMHSTVIGSNNGTSLAAIKESKGLANQIQDQEQLISELRIRKVTLEEELFTTHQLQEACLVATPTWDALNLENKRRIIQLLLERIDYDGRTEKLELTLSGRGIRALYGLKQDAGVIDHAK